MSRVSEHGGDGMDAAVGRTPPPVTDGLQDPWCPRCRTTDYLVFESARPRVSVDRPTDSTWAVEYWCSGCDSYFGHETARLPGGIGAAGRLSDVVYVHCGVDMSATAAEPRFVDADPSAARFAPRAAAEGAQVWRCRCGFELTVPDRGAAG